MSFFSSIFKNKQKPTYQQVVLITSLKIFKLYGIDDPTDIQMFKMFAYLCVCGRTYMKVKVKDSDAKQMALFAACNDSMASLGISLNDVIDAGRLDLVSNLTEKAGWSIFVIYSVEITVRQRKREKNAEQILLDKMNGPFGFPGIAGIVVVDGVLGEGRSKEYLPHIVMETDIFLKTLVEI